MIAIIRFASLAAVAWKNGGGLTREYAVGPAGAGLDAFDWRVSAADVGKDGPFSRFDGVDRTLAVLDGDGLELRFAHQTAWLSPTSDAFAFPGDVPAEARLTGGPIRDLNVMTRRAAWRHAVRRLTLRADEGVGLGGDVNLVVAEEPCALRIGDRREALARGDAALTQDGPLSIAIESPSPTRIIVVALYEDAGGDRRVRDLPSARRRGEG